MGSIEPIIDGLRRKIQHWVTTTEPLLSNAAAGDTQLEIRSTRRFKAGDEFLIRNENEEIENYLFVDKIIDNTHLTLQNPLQFNWTVAESSSIIRTFSGNFVRAVHFGEPDIISLNELPAITVNANRMNSDWMAVRVTKERYDIEIGVFVSGATHEEGTRLVTKIADHIQYGLKQNLYPIANDYEQTTLLANVLQGDYVFKIPDTTPFSTYGQVMLENDHYTQEFLVQCVLDSQTIQVTPTSIYDFNINNTTVIIPHRFLFNSWPADITYGKINKGTLLKAAVINFFCEEAEDQLHSSWHDTQLR